jgi:hypothetical protein
MQGDESHDKSNNDTQDKDLRGRFAALRSEEAAEAPEFALPGPGGLHPRSRLSGNISVTVACVVAMVAVVIGLRLIPWKPERNTTPVASLTEWKAPTDFLLETPGRELLETVPVIGAWPDSSTLSEPGKSVSKGNKSSRRLEK